MARNGAWRASRPGERGAVSIKAILIVAFLVVAAVTLIKVIPVYIEQQEIEHDTDELARKASLGLAAYSKDKIEKEIQTLITQHSLPDGSIKLATMDNNHAAITVKYTRSIDLFVTSYAWDVDYSSDKKGI